MTAEWKQPCWNIVAEPGGPFACVLTWCCPCITYGINVSKLGDAKAEVMCSGQFAPACCLYCCVTSVGCPCIAHIPTRKYIRKKYGIKEPQNSLLEDVLLTWCCSCCAIIQDYNEIAAGEGAAKGVVLTDIKTAAEAARADMKKHAESARQPASATAETEEEAKESEKEAAKGGEEAKAEPAEVKEEAVQEEVKEAALKEETPNEEASGDKKEEPAPEEDKKVEAAGTGC